MKRFIHSGGAIAAARPMAPVMAATTPPADPGDPQARADWPAPMLVATIAVSAVPKPKAIGTRMYSRRAAMP